METKTIRNEYCTTYCKTCKSKMMQIPIRKIDSLIMIEHYCPDCEKSIITYENFEKI